MGILYGTFVDDEECGRTYAYTTPFDAIERVRSGLADGLIVDVFNDNGDISVSHEVVPGRSITSWHDEECH